MKFSSIYFSGVMILKIFFEYLQIWKLAKFILGSDLFATSWYYSKFDFFYQKYGNEISRKFIFFLICIFFFWNFQEVFFCFGEWGFSGRSYWAYFVFFLVVPLRVSSLAVLFCEIFSWSLIDELIRGKPYQFNACCSNEKLSNCCDCRSGYFLRIHFRCFLYLFKFISGLSQVISGFFCVEFKVLSRSF